jgi:hypothetical protein
VLARRRPEILATALLTAWAVVPIVLLVAVWRHGDVLTGSDGALPGSDQLYYLSIARESGEHVLFGIRFDLGPVNRAGLHPVYLVSGVLDQLGLDLRAAVWLWKPVAAALLVAGFAAYVRPFELGRAGTVAALVLALAYFSPLLPILDWTGVLDPWQSFMGLLVEGELMPAWQLWGYVHTAALLGLMALTAVLGERALTRGDPRSVAGTALAAATVTVMHPWQGVTLAAMLAGAAGWAEIGRRRAAAPGRLRRLLAAAIPLAAIAVAVTHLLALSHTDARWDAAGEQAATPYFGVGYLLMGFGPLAAFAALGIRRPDSTRERMLLLWLVGSAIVYLAVSNSRFHAFEGMSLPLAVLAVRGWRRLRLPAPAAALAIAAVTLPGFAYQALRLRDSVRLDRGAYYLNPGEARALDHLDARPGEGGVLAPDTMGRSVPAHAGRSTWVGQFVWTPDYETRRARAEALFSGSLTGSEARRLVRATGARFLLAGCAHRADLRPLLTPLRPAVRRFGCATVYELPAPAR